MRRRAAEASQREAIKQSKAADANFACARKAVDESFTIVSESKLLIVPGLRHSSRRATRLVHEVLR